MIKAVKTWAWILVLSFVLGSFAGCRTAQAPETTTEPTLPPVTATPIPTEPVTAEPTATPAPTSAPTPVQTPVPTVTKAPVVTAPPTTQPPKGPDDLTKEEKRQLALVVAREIAGKAKGNTDLERVLSAARMVEEYCLKADYTTEGKDYREAYGVFIKGEYSCAGATRALGMVLEEMGFSWTHANENQWSHQWCIVTMDGKTGFADGQVGLAGYGEHPAANL